VKTLLSSQSIMQSRTKHADEEEEDLEIQQFKVSLYEIIASAVLFIACVIVLFFATSVLRR
jgi:hypothetical protein